jgi:hypothetical protein
VFTGFIIDGYFWQILIILILIIEISTAVEIGETCVQNISFKHVFSLKIMNFEDVS